MMPLFFQRLLRLPRYYLLRVKRLKGDPVYLARGFALGVFMGNLPFVPQTLLLIPLTVFLQSSTVAAIISSVIVNNPFTVTFQYYLAWRIGSFILPGRGSLEHLHNIMGTFAEKGLIDGFKEIGQIGFDTLFVLQFGGVVMGLVMAIGSYYPVRKFFRTVRERRQKKHRLDV
ncbi:DUF2062 domain-containing protein [Candidatus Electronema sp. PJ]|uniref:DUF2062 domain-containing protein n=1 Tax=Candidatus Electronema sp. PJ TaxID=3401572 RepID=UPI003AA95295